MLLRRLAGAALLLHVAAGNAASEGAEARLHTVLGDDAVAEIPIVSPFHPATAARA